MGEHGRPTDGTPNQTDAGLRHSAPPSDYWRHHSQSYAATTLRRNTATLPQHMYSAEKRTRSPHSERQNETELRRACRPVLPAAVLIRLARACDARFRGQETPRERSQKRRSSQQPKSVRRNLDSGFGCRRSHPQHGPPTVHGYSQVYRLPNIISDVLLGGVSWPLRSGRLALTDERPTPLSGSLLPGRPVSSGQNPRLDAQTPLRTQWKDAWTRLVARE